MDFVKQEFKCGKNKRAQQNKNMKLFMIQGARFFSSTKKLAKVNMQSSLSGFGKVQNGQHCVLRIDIFIISYGLE